MFEFKKNKPISFLIFIISFAFLYLVVLGPMLGYEGKMTGLFAIVGGVLISGWISNYTHGFKKEPPKRTNF